MMPPDRIAVMCECGWFGWITEGKVAEFDIVVCPLCAEPLERQPLEKDERQGSQWQVHSAS